MWFLVLLHLSEVQHIKLHFINRCLSAINNRIISMSHGKYYNCSQKQTMGLVLQSMGKNVNLISLLDKYRVKSGFTAYPAYPYPKQEAQVKIGPMTSHFMPITTYSLQRIFWITCDCAT